MKTIKFLILFVCLGTISFSQVQTNDTKVIYDSKGNKFGEGIYRYNKQEGKWIYYFSNGRKMAEGNFQSGDGTDIGSNGIPRNGRVGKWYTYYENGTLKQESNFVNGKLNGIYKSYYESGSIKADGYYVDDKYDGKWIIYFSNGKKMAEGNFQSGDGTDLGATGIPRNGRVGKWYVYNEKNGFLEQNLNYVNGKLNGIAETYYESGKLKEYRSYVDGKLNGIYKIYYENGNLKQESNTINDKYNGITKLYNENGSLASVENYVDDKLNGITKLYYKSGSLQAEQNYINGKLNGIYKIYYENGNLKQESNTINEKNNGITKVFNENGSLARVENFVDDKLNGITKLYNENGSLNREENYVNGVLQSSKTISQTNTITNSPCSVKSQKNNDIEYCKNCEGSGSKTVKSSSKCTNCANWNAEYRSKVACNVCRDSRLNPNIKTWKETCGICKGSGRDFEQEKRNKDFGGYDTRLINGVYNGVYNNLEFKSVSIEHRKKGMSTYGTGTQTEFTYLERSNICSCLGSGWVLPSVYELKSITNDLDSRGFEGDGRYATSDYTGTGKSFDPVYIWVVNFGQSISSEKLQLGSEPNYDSRLKCKVICVKRI
jgi:antitoxin component YwqK of YwqJK toxin-antitoxin module